MKPKCKYMYHLTDADNLENILENGLRTSTTDMMPCAKPGRLYLLNTDKRHVACVVALNQLFLNVKNKKVARIEIPTHKCNGVRKDVVGEYTSTLGYQWFCKNKVIKPQFFNKIEEFDFTEDEYYESRAKVLKEIYSPKLFLAIREQEEIWKQMGNPSHIGTCINLKEETAQLEDLTDKEIKFPDGNRFTVNV